MTLNLETFERFMLSHDRDTLSNTFSFELLLDAPLQRDRLQSAIDQTAAQHPLATARLDETGNHWVIDGRRLVLGVTSDPLEQRVFDLRKEAGVRIATRCRPDGGHSLVLVIHHACLDALGTLQFIKDLAENYSSPRDRQRVDVTRSALSFLSKYRSSYGGNRLRSRLRWPIDLLAMVSSYELFFNRPVSLPVGQAGRQEKDPVESDHVQTRTKCLDESQFASVRGIAKSHRQTLNDHLLTACFLGLERWFESHEREQTRSLHRVMVPVSLRQGEIRSASNMVAMVNLDRKPGNVKSLAKFRRRISLEMGAVKRFRVGITGNRMLWFVHKLFGDWSILDDQDRCMATCVLSNVGDVSRLAGDQQSNGAIRFGDVTTTSVDFVGFVGKNTHVCFHVFRYLGRLKIVATYNPHRLTGADADFLLNAIVNHLLMDDQR